MTAPLVYAAHPMTCYGTDHERDRLAVLAERFPGAEIVNPATRFRSSAGWLRAWPRMLPTLSTVVVFADEDGCIGAGCLVEIADACRLRVPVLLLDDAGILRELVSLNLLPPGERDAWQAAWPVGGERPGWAGRCANRGSPPLGVVPP